MEKYTLMNFVPQKIHNLICSRAMFTAFLLLVYVVNAYAISTQSQNQLITIKKSNVDLLNIMGGY